MKLSLITSSLIALSAAAPAFEERRTYPAGLRSPLNIVKRAVEPEPPVVSPVVAARFVSQGGGGFSGGRWKREEDEVEDAPLAARFVSQGGGGFSGGRWKREEVEVEDAPLAARFVSQGGGRSRAGVSFSSNHKVKARFVSQDGSGSDMEARENHSGFPQGHKNGFTQDNSQGGHQSGNSAFNFNQQQQRQRQTNNFQSNQNGLQLGEAKIQINGQETGVPIGQPTLVSVNGPQILSMSTNQGGCLPFSVASNGLPGSAIVQAAFGGGRSFQAGNGVNPILVNNRQILVWCSPNNLPLNLLQTPGF